VNNEVAVAFCKATSHF